MPWFPGSSRRPRWVGPAWESMHLVGCLVGTTVVAATILILLQPFSGTAWECISCRTAATMGVVEGKSISGLKATSSFTAARARSCALDIPTIIQADVLPPHSTRAPEALGETP